MANKRRLVEFKQSAAPNEVDMYIYGDVKGDSWTWWDGKEESNTSAEYFRKELEKYQNISRINIYINSYGGSVFEGNAIYNQLKRHPAEKVVYIDAFACSVASVIAMSGDRVIMSGNAVMMLHDMWMMAVGNARELRKAAADLDVINTAGRSAYLVKSAGKMSEETLVQLMEQETWLTAAQCIEYGLADEVTAEVENAPPPDQVKQRWNAIKEVKNRSGEPEKEPLFSWEQILEKLPEVFPQLKTPPTDPEPPIEPPVPEQEPPKEKADPEALEQLRKIICE